MLGVTVPTGCRSLGEEVAAAARSGATSSGVPPTPLSRWGLLGADLGRVRDASRWLLAAWSPPGRDGWRQLCPFYRISGEPVRERGNK